jgi:hypothetical protein
MMKKIALLAAIMLAAPSGAFAQDVYCALGTIRAVNPRSPNSVIESVRTHCNPGELVALDQAHNFTIAMLCDFSKTIMEVGGATLCVLASPRAIRNR